MTLPAYVKASAAVHAAAGAAVLLAPAAWPWALGAVGANHLVLTGGGLWPRSRWLGRNWTRLPAAAAARREIAITIDDGPDPEVTPAVLDLLDAHQARATFFVIASAAARHPALCREIVRRGHSVQNHSDRHSHAFSLLGPRGLAREIGAAQARLADLVGVAPRFFRAPAGPAQSLARAGARAARARAGELDPARLRHGPARAGARAGAALRRPGRRRHPAAARRQRGADRRPGSRWCSPSCRRCSSASPRPACSRPPWPTRCPRARRPRPARWRRPRDEPRGRGPGLARAGRAGERLVPARRPLRPALRPRQAALGSGLSPSPHPRPDRAGRARARHRLRPGPARQPARGGRGRGAARPLAGRLGAAAQRRAPHRHRAQRARGRPRPRRARRRRRVRLRRHAQRRLSAGRHRRHPRRAALRRAARAGRGAGAGPRRARRCAARCCCASAMPPRGAASPPASGSTAWCSCCAAAGRGRRTAGPVSEWIAHLVDLGFQVSDRPMSEGTPFANVLLVATLGPPRSDS